MDTKELGNGIRLAREEAGLGQAELANALHIDCETLRRWETGTRPPFYMMAPLAHALGDVVLCDEADIVAWRRERIAAHLLLTLCILPLLVTLLAYNLISAVFPIWAVGDAVVYGRSWYWILIGLGETLAAYGIAAAALYGLRARRGGFVATVALMPLFLAASIVTAVVLSRYQTIAAEAGYRAAKLYPLGYILAIAGMFYVLLGVWAPMLKKNLFLGIRCEGTLRDPIIWAQTHRVAFVHFQLCGLICMLLCLFLPNINGVIWFLVGTFTMILFPIIYATRKMLCFYPEMNRRSERRK